jgi:hypothetical protein
MKTSSRKAWSVWVAVAALAVAVYANNDPWKAKDWQQWDDKDIQKVINQSPWTQHVMVESTWKPIDKIVANNAGGTQNSSGGNVLAAEHDSNARTRGDNATFDVYWSSARTMREALARRAAIHNGRDMKDAQEFVAAVQDEYQVTVQGPDMAPFQRKSEKDYAGLAWLQLKKSKEKIPASHVVYTRDDSGTVNAAIFFFPKKNASGAPTIGPDDKNVDFACKVGDSTIHANFELQKMEDAKGLDL